MWPLLQVSAETLRFSHWAVRATISGRAMSCLFSQLMKDTLSGSEQVMVLGQTLVIALFSELAVWIPASPWDGLLSTFIQKRLRTLGESPQTVLTHSACSLEEGSFPLVIGVSSDDLNILERTLMLFGSFRSSVGSLAPILKETIAVVLSMTSTAFV